MSTQPTPLSVPPARKISPIGDRRLAWELWWPDLLGKIPEIPEQPHQKVLVIHHVPPRSTSGAGHGEDLRAMGYESFSAEIPDAEAKALPGGGVLLAGVGQGDFTTPMRLSPALLQTLPASWQPGCCNVRVIHDKLPCSAWWTLL